MAIFLRQSHLIKPVRWGSFADTMYAIRKNSEKIYGIDPDSNVLVMPGFWGFPCLDYSGKQNNGTPYGGLSYRSECLDFDGFDDYVKVHNPTSLDFTSTSKFSVGLRINVNSRSEYETFITKSISEQTKGYNVGLDNTGRLRFLADLSYSVLTSNILPLNQSIFCEIVFDTNNSVSIYIDGILDNTGSVTALTSDTCDLVLGRIYVTTSGYYFHGAMGEVRINNSTLTAEQVALFYDLPYGLYQPVNKPIYFFSKVTSLTVTLPCITAEILGEQAASLNVTLPMITAEILGGGGGFLDATLPMITAEMRGGALLEATLPCITAEIEGKTGIVGEIDVTLPIIVADIEGKVEVLGDINAILPVIRAHIAGKTGKVGSIDVTLPMIEAALTGYQEVTGDINATLPMITARIVGTPDRFATCTPLRFTEPI